MGFVLKTLGALGLLAALAVVWRVRRPVRYTALKSAWQWLTAGMTLWCAVWVLTMGGAVVSAPVSDQLWYAVGTVMLCPLVAVLGARRPGVRYWSWFVLLPLVVVLEFPALSAWTNYVPRSRLELEAAVVLGWFLVLVMGAGNYFGTRFTAPTILLAAGLVLVISPATSFVADAHAEMVRVWGSGCACIALYWARWTAQRSADCEPGLDRLWADFRDWFGIVWVKRVMDRVNQAAQNERLAARLDLYGLTPVSPGGAVPTADVERLAHTLRWLLKRFVEPAWIDQRLGVDAETGQGTDGTSRKTEESSQKGQ